MSKRFTAAIIGIDTLLLVLLFYSGASVMAYLVSVSQGLSPLLMNSFNVFSYVLVPYEGGPSPAPAFAESFVYWPAYIFIVGIVINVVFAV
jgi:hypothetical protein